jgi:hypothetical protein
MKGWKKERVYKLIWIGTLPGKVDILLWYITKFNQISKKKKLCEEFVSIVKSRVVKKG